LPICFKMLLTVALTESAMRRMLCEDLPDLLCAALPKECHVVEVCGYGSHGGWLIP
jgi:hypothetical protein